MCRFADYRNWGAKCSVLHLDVGRAAKQTWIGSFLCMDRLPLQGRSLSPAPIGSAVSHSRVFSKNGHLVVITLSAAAAAAAAAATAASPPYSIVDVACPGTMEERSLNC
ncbi:hypothetical protein ACSS6W_001127 [Trichoderma asperelloides]